MGNNPLEVSIECVYSATTREVTNPRLSHKISVPKEDDHNNHKILQNRMHIILYYEKNKKEEDSGLYSGGWIRQSLGNALMEKPILAGRFRRSENGDLEIISNDSGVRCVEVRVPLTMVKFLELKKNKKFDGETKLVSWNHVDASNPLFSPLFYIQITNFQCGGYSIGISFSLLLVDPLTMTKFLKEWAKIHTSWIYENEFPKKSLFYTQDCKWMGCYQLDQSDTSSTSNSYNKISKTLIFNIISDQKINSRDDQTCKYLVSLCLEEAENKFLNEINSINYFNLIIKEESGGAKVEITSKTTDIHASERSRYEIKSLNWEDLKINEVVFHKNNELVDVSQWIACDDTLEGVVQVVISPHSEDNSGIKVYITFPCDK